MVKFIGKDQKCTEQQELGFPDGELVHLRPTFLMAERKKCQEEKRKNRWGKKKTKKF